MALFSSPSLTNALSKHGTEWKFIPKRAPWFGGFWERLIGLTKLSLKKVLGRAFTTFTSLQTLIVEIEAILNDLPLTYVPTDICDPDPITPAHLLYGRKIVCVLYHMTPQYNQCDPDFGETELQSLAKKQATLLQHFLTRWRREYLTGLREFHQASTPNIQTVKPGAVVLVHDDTPRISWRLAVVEDTIAGEDDLVRAANIRTSSGRTNQPVTKLYPLEVNSTDPLLKSCSTPQSVNSSDSGDQTVDQENTMEERPARQAVIRGDSKSKNGHKHYVAPRRMSRTSN